tara:strand:- start:386 stop:508 length:123 start_codon:yes stop_codon:yes gene_type:complete
MLLKDRRKGYYQGKYSANWLEVIIVGASLITAVATITLAG